MHAESKVVFDPFRGRIRSASFKNHVCIEYSTNVDEYSSNGRTVETTSRKSLSSRCSQFFGRAAQDSRSISQMSYKKMKSNNSAHSDNEKAVRSTAKIRPYVTSFFARIHGNGICNYEIVQSVNEDEIEKESIKTNSPFFTPKRSSQSIEYDSRVLRLMTEEDDLSFISPPKHAPLNKWNVGNEMTTGSKLSSQTETSSAFHCL